MHHSKIDYKSIKNKNNESLKLKKYKLDEIVFSCLRSKIAYEKDIKIKNIFMKNGCRDIFNCNQIKCDSEFNSKIDTVVNKIVEDMNSPIFYNTNNLYSKDLYSKDSQGYIIWKSNTIYLTFRGSKNINDLINTVNIKPKKINFTDFNNNNEIYIHNGFYNKFFSIESKITQDIKEIINNYPIQRIIFSGHSLGGSLAAIAAAYYGCMFKSIFITCHTFGIPLIGNEGFINWFTNNVDESKRIETEEDIVPLIPINNNFKHIPNGIMLKKDGNINNDFYEIKKINYKDFFYKIINSEDIVFNHSCEKYIERLLLFKNLSNDI